MKKKSAIIGLFFVSFLLQSCHSTNSQIVETQISNKTANKTLNETEADFQTSSDGKVDYKGVSFQFNPQSWAKVEMKEIIEDQPLEEESQKPDENFPAHPVFKFIQKDEKNKDLDKGRILVFPIERYRQMYAVSSDATEYLNNNLENLRKVILDKTFRVNKEIPFLLFYDSHQAFVAKVENIPFKNGTSVCFLTQYEPDEHIINNEMLKYYCQGITSDKKNYIFAEFSVKVPFLPNNSDIDNFEEYKLPRQIHHFLSENENKKYKQYISKINKRLEELPSDKYEPNLKHFEEIISSLKIEK